MEICLYCNTYLVQNSVAYRCPGCGRWYGDGCQWCGCGNFSPDGLCVGCGAARNVNRNPFIAQSDCTRPKKPLSGAVVRRKMAAQPLVAGDMVCIERYGDIAPTDGSRHPIGITLQGANVGGMVDVVVFGPVDGFTGLTPGKKLPVGYAESSAVIFVTP